MNFYQMSEAQFIACLNDPKVSTLFFILVIWIMIWKGIALWKAAQNNSKSWFISLLVLNTVGILEIIYIFFFSDKKGKSEEK